MIWKTTSLITAFLFLFSPISLFSQNSELLNLEHLFSADYSTSESLSAAKTEEFRKLFYNLQPTLYIEDQKIKTFDKENPVKAEVYANSVDLLTTQNILFNTVELLAFKLNDAGEISAPIDISNLTSFKNLKFIYVECASNCTISRIENMFLNTGNLTVIYLVATPE
ncbi:hypothetical protein FHG64_02090 [Antarcticibacterium flavum]|uniref:Uncharacterized protein n=1 Tax=Antarcticibacterium flavum TaxID=2058175 RepID=A0A5B7WYY6_9FLAO|nr:MULTISPECIES: hypothetical protein [Antarcticibacterium]MCM4159037.1 hypothetical protein [Antarcticibacterium sp. W02-3]QCY68280.1 hypothetical protein FHG64_02090 [Antarcticibacterium flavum]